MKTQLCTSTGTHGLLGFGTVLCIGSLTCFYWSVEFVGNTMLTSICIIYDHKILL